MENMVRICYHIQEFSSIDQAAHRVLRMEIWELGRNPSIRQLYIIIDCRRCLSEASVNPQQRGDAYSIFLTKVACRYLRHCTGDSGHELLSTRRA